MTAPDTPHSTGPGKRELPLTWAITLAVTLASLAGIVALTSNLVATDELLSDGVGQAVKIDETTTRGVQANEALPPTDAAVRDSTPAVLATVDSLHRANHALTALGDQVRALAEVLADARDPLARTVATAEGTEQTVRRSQQPAGSIADTLRAVDRRVTGLGPALERTLTISRSIEAKLRVLGPGGRPRRAGRAGRDRDRLRPLADDAGQRRLRPGRLHRWAVSSSGSGRKSSRTSSIASRCPGRAPPPGCASWSWPCGPSGPAGTTAHRWTSGASSTTTP